MRVFLLASALLAGPGCARAPDLAEPTQRGPASAEALCAEHSVLEAVCPKCNPALAAVFQAKGDWCAEHGFAESFCPICHPERGGRPAVDVAADGPADGTRVRFRTRETARLAGIQTRPALEAAREETITVVARLAVDGTKRALVSAPAPGLVTEIRADVGARVRRGAPLAMLRSADIGADRAQAQAARARVAAAEQVLSRKRGLIEVGATSLREVQEAELALANARAELETLESQLAMVGDGSAGTYTLVSPLSGEVIAREVSVGMAVQSGAPLFEVVDASKMWAELDLPERALGQVAVGSKATITLDSLPNRTFEGTLAYIAPVVSAQTRTALARVEIDNADRALRANLYGAAQIVVQDAQPTVSVPAMAVQNAKGVSFVFVRLAEDEYALRRVEVRSRQGEVVQLSGGVKPGEAVVTQGSFLLKTEILKDSIGAGCCDVD